MKIEEALIHSYAMLVQRGRCKISDIPEMYRSEVRDYIAIDIHEEVQDEKYDFIVEDTGPLTLPKIYLTVKSGGVVEHQTSDIFHNELLNGRPVPEGVKYNLLRCEPLVAFTTKPNMVVIQTDDGFKVKITGEPAVHIEAMPSMVAVLKVTADNYEDMNLSIYVTIDK